MFWLETSFHWINYAPKHDLNLINEFNIKDFQAIKLHLWIR